MWKRTFSGYRTFSDRAFLVAAALRPADLRFLVSAAFCPAAFRFLVNAAFFPAALRSRVLAAFFALHYVLDLSSLYFLPR